MTEGPTTREYFEALLKERDRASDLASDEREKAASALRAAMERSIDVHDRSDQAIGGTDAL